MHQYSLYYLLAVNSLTFLLYGIDKYKAKKGRWRISEATLLTMAAIGGSIGAWAGMRSCHHLHQLILGIIHKKTRIYCQKNRQIAEEENKGRKQEGFSRHLRFFLSFLSHFPKEIPRKPGQKGTSCGKEQHADPETEMGKGNASVPVEAPAKGHTEGKDKRKEDRQKPLATICSCTAFFLFFHPTFLRFPLSRFLRFL